MTRAVNHYEGVSKKHRRAIILIISGLVLSNSVYGLLTNVSGSEVSGTVSPMVLGPSNLTWFTYVRNTLFMDNNTLETGNYSPITSTLAPSSLAYDGTNGYIYVANRNANTISVISDVNYSIIKTIEVGLEPSGIAFNSTSGYVYVANYGSNNVSVIDSASNSVLYSFSVGTNPDAIAYDSNGYILTANAGSNDVTVYDLLLNGTVSPTITVGTDPVAVIFDTANQNVYVANKGSNDVSYFSGGTTLSTPTLVTTSTVAVGTSPSGLAYDSSTQNIYVSVSGSDNIAGIYGSNNTIIPGTISVGSAPTGIAYDAFNNFLYVSNSNSNSVSIVNLSNNNVRNTINVGNTPEGVAIGNSGNKMYVANSNSDTVSILEYAHLYKVNFTELGLPSGTPWYLNITGVISYSSTGSTLTSSLTNQIYYYTVSTSDKVYSAPSGSFTVNGTDIQLNITFSKVLYNVTFTQSGLSSGSSWYVNMTGQNNSGALNPGGSITYQLTNGTYNYSVSTTNKSFFSPDGSITVNGGGVVNVVTFSLVEYNVAITETGLPPGAQWFFNLSTGQSFSSNTSFLNLSLPNGTYYYTVGSFNKIYRANSSSFTVNGGVTSIHINFTEVFYYATFNETGIPPGTIWFVNITGVQNLSSTGSSIIAMLVNGTYSYTVQSVNDTVLSPGGTLTVSGTNLTLNVKFTSDVYPVIFNEIGLPSGSAWYVNVSSGQKLLASTDSTSLLEPNGTYSYTISSANKIYRTSNNTGNFTVQGADRIFTVKFSVVNYTVTFIQNGLPPGTKWYSNLTGIGNFSSTSSVISVNLTNGTYDIIPGVTDKIYSSPEQYFTVDGSNLDIMVSYGLVKYLVNFTESGISSGSFWSVNISGYPTSGSLITGSSYDIFLVNGTYSFTASSSNTSIKNYTGKLVVQGSNEKYLVKFDPVVYQVSFIEHGAPSGTTWYVDFNGTFESSNSDTMIVSATYGDYTYHIMPLQGYAVSEPTGTVPVHGINMTVSINFSQVTYDLSIKESGLPLNMTWQAVINGVSYNLSSGEVSHLTLPNGTYKLHIMNLLEYYPSSNIVKLTVKGKAVSFNVSFIHFAYIAGILFPSNATLYVNGIQQNVSASGIFNLSEKSGLYNVTIDSPGYRTDSFSFILEPGQSISIRPHLVRNISASSSVILVLMSGPILLIIISVAIITSIRKWK